MKVVDPMVANYSLSHFTSHLTLKDPNLIELYIILMYKGALMGKLIQYINCTEQMIKL